VQTLPAASFGGSVRVQTRLIAAVGGGGASEYSGDLSEVQAPVNADAAHGIERMPQHSQLIIGLIA